MFVRASKSTVVLVCVAAGMLLLVGAEAANAYQSATNADMLSLSAKKGNAAALQQLRTLAVAGDARAQSNLGVMYKNGEGVAKDAAQL